MRKIAAIIFFGMFCTIGVAHIGKDLDSILSSPYLEKTQLGLMVCDLTNDTVIFARGEKQIMRPASTMKLLTAITALDMLGSTYDYRTQMFMEGAMNDGVLDGNICLYGGFDAAFDESDVKAFADALHREGIEAIRGKIYADLSFKDSIRLGEGWCWDDENPVLSPLLMGDKGSEDAVIEALKRELNVPVMNEEVMVDEALMFLERVHPITVILQRMIKESDNLYAESMLYQLAHLAGGDSATADDGLELIREKVHHVGLNPDDYRFADGSGLSLYNYASAELLCRMLRFAYLYPEIYDALYDALPIAAHDGTLKNRMHGTLAAGNVRAKTGTLTGVSSLAGYCTAASGSTLCFAIISHGALQQEEARKLQDSICAVLCEY